MESKFSPCTCLNLRRASKSLTDVYDQYLSDTKLSISQYSILRHIHELQPINVSDLSIALRLDRTTLVRTLKPLEEHVFIEDISKEGTRNRELRLTKDGEKLFLAAHEKWEMAQLDIAAYLGEEDAKKLTDILYKIEKYKK